jgi:Flp pilus assembly protein TadD
VQIWQELASAWSALGNDNQAIVAIDRGLKFYPKNLALWNLKGLIQTNNAQYNQACQTYRDSRAIAGESMIIMDSMRQLGCRLN